MKTFSQSDSLMQTRSLAPLSDMRPATLDKIEQAVRKVFAGFDANEVTMAQIAKSANVSLQTLYKYFGDKQTLFYTIMDIVLGRLAARIMDHLQGIDSVQDRLRKTLCVMLIAMCRPLPVRCAANTAANSAITAVSLPPAKSAN